MTREDILKECRTNARSVFVVGCFETRVTLLAQQVRAINLVDALLSTRGLIRDNGRVAIIGAGAAGITASVAFAKAAPGLSAIHVYERQGEWLHLQANSDRFLHPHLYDWPRSHAIKRDAGLPIMNWKADKASNVAIRLKAYYDSACIGSAVELLPNKTVTKVDPFPEGGCRVDVEDIGSIHSEKYDVAILCIGFGYEKFLGGENESYWNPSKFAKSILRPGGPHSVFVSGNGDGGLVDFMMAVYNKKNHKEICDFVTSYKGLRKVSQRLLKIEEQAWVNGPSIDLYANYQAQLLPILPTNMLLDVEPLLRKNVRVSLHTNYKTLFKRETAILNRFGAFLAIEADANARTKRIRLCVHKEFPSVDVPPKSGVVQIGGEVPHTPDFRILRLGPDGESNCVPFQNLLDWRTRVASSRGPGFRQATPKLSVEAKLRFAAIAKSTNAGSKASPKDDLSGGTNLSNASTAEIAHQVETIATYLSRLPVFEPIGELQKKQIRQLLRGSKTDQKPFIFYHWRQMHGAIHWVDFYFLRSLQKLQTLGLTAYALVTEIEGNASERTISAIVKKILGRIPITLAQAKLEQVEYEAHTTRYVEPPAQLGKIYGQKLDETTAWLQFVPYFVSKKGRRGYLQLVWKRHAEERYEPAYANGAADIIVQVITQDILIGGALAKLTPLLIEQRPYESFRAWLSSRKPNRTYQEVEDLLGYFRALDADSLPTTSKRENEVSLRALQDDWVGLLDEGSGERLRTAVRHLAIFLERWDRLYFK